MGLEAGAICASPNSWGEVSYLHCVELTLLWKWKKILTSAFFQLLGTFNKLFIRFMWDFILSPGPDRTIAVKQTHTFRIQTIHLTVFTVVLFSRASTEREKKKFLIDQIIYEDSSHERKRRQKWLKSRFSGVYMRTSVGNLCDNPVATSGPTSRRQVKSATTRGRCATRNRLSKIKGSNVWNREELSWYPKWWWHQLSEQLCRYILNEPKVKIFLLLMTLKGSLWWPLNSGHARTQSQHDLTQDGSHASSASLMHKASICQMDWFLPPV